MKGEVSVCISTPKPKEEDVVEKKIKRGGGRAEQRWCHESKGLESERRILLLEG